MSMLILLGSLLAFVWVVQLVWLVVHYKGHKERERCEEETRPSDSAKGK